MSFLRRGKTRRGKVAAAATTVVALAAFQALAIVGATVALAEDCDQVTPNTLNVDLFSGDDVSLFVDSDGNLESSNTNCDDAPNSQITTINVTGEPNCEDFTIDDSVNGQIAATTWNINLGGDDCDDLNFQLGPGDDTLVLTATSFTRNGAVGTISNVEFFDARGDDGDDTLDASGMILFDTDLRGGDGDDFLAPGTGQFDFIDGNADSDTLSYQTRTSCMFIDNDNTAGADVNCDGDNTDPTEEQDELDDCFDAIISGSGNDLIDDGNCDGFFDSTVIAPGAGDDDVVGDDTFDTIDFSSSGLGGVVIDHPNGTATGEGSDTFEGSDNFIGTVHDDTLLVNADSPGAGVDSFSGLDGVDLVDASAAPAGVDVDLDDLDPVNNDDLENLTGSAFGDELTGNENNNVIRGLAGEDDLTGEEGSDTFFGGPGNDEFDGDQGNDKVNYIESPAGVTVDLSLGFATGGEGDDSFVDVIETIIGSNFADSITGGSFAGGGTVNFLFKGKDGKDVLTGFNSNDTLNGGKKGDILRGLGGGDTLLGKKGPDDLFGGNGSDIGKGGPGFDECFNVESAFSCV
jgi:hypothetical protein